MIPYARQNITEEDIAAVAAALREDYLTTGPRVGEFEQAFADYVKAPYAVAVSSGTAALHLCTLALGVKLGDKVLVPSLTFAASVNCIRYCGGEPVFVDIDPTTGLLDLALVEQKLQEDSYVGIVAVDYAGFPVDMEALRAMADKHGCWIIEDSCHAPGGAFQTRNGGWSQCGSGDFADLAIFSFHPAKHMTTGEGGMITTANEELYSKLLRLRTHGITRDPDLLTEQPGGWYYEIHETGYNYRLTDFQSVLGISQLRRAAAGLARRRELAAQYDAAFADTEIQIIIPPNHIQHAYHLYVVRVPARKVLYDQLRKEKIFTQVHYVPAHLLHVMGGKRGDLPHAEQFYDHCLSIPMYDSLSDSQQKEVIRQVKNIVQNYP